MAHKRAWPATSVSAHCWEIEVAEICWPSGIEREGLDLRSSHVQDDEENHFCFKTWNHILDTCIFSCKAILVVDEQAEAHSSSFFTIIDMKVPRVLEHWCASKTSTSWPVITWNAERCLRTSEKAPSRKSRVLMVNFPVPEWNSSSRTAGKMRQFAMRFRTVSDAEACFRMTKKTNVGPPPKAVDISEVLERCRVKQMDLGATKRRRSNVIRRKMSDDKRDAPRSSGLTACQKQGPEIAKENRMKRRKIIDELRSSLQRVRRESAEFIYHSEREAKSGLSLRDEILASIKEPSFKEFVAEMEKGWKEIQAMKSSPALREPSYTTEDVTRKEFVHTGNVKKLSRDPDDHHHSAATRYLVARKTWK